MKQADHILFDTMELDKSLRSRLWEAIAGDLDGILNDFYDRLVDSKYGELLQNVDIANLIVRQKQHWQSMILDGRDGEYEDSVARMHQHHNRIGLDNALYIRAYLYFLKKLHQVIIRNAAGPNEAARLVSALQVIVSDDMSSSLEVSWAEFEEIKS